MAETLAAPGADLAGRPFLARLWWVDELLGVLARPDSLAHDRLELPPVARDDEFRLAGGAMLAVSSAAGVLANDFDPAGQSLSAALVVAPAHAAVFELRADGSFLYHPNPGYQGADQFVYRASDGRLTDDATVQISVLADPPVARNDTAYTGPGQPETDQLQITIYALGNDTGMGIQVASVGPASYGITGIAGGGVWYRPGPGFGFGPGQVPVDAFSYTIRDYFGQSSTATVTVYAVEVTGYTVQWQKPDGTWLPLADSDPSWVGDSLRWSPQYDFDPQYFSGAALWRHPADGSSPWYPFAQGGQEIITGADVGDWEVQAEVRFAGMPWQTGFAARQWTQGHRLTAEITSIQWETHTANPPQAIVLSPDQSYVRGYPDATNPGDPMRDKVDVVVSVLPQKANIPVLVNWYDVDEPALGVLDETDPQNVGVNPPDNFSGGRAAPDASLAGGALATDAAGKVRTTLSIFWAQPGNNYRVAAAPGGPGRQALFAPLKPLAPDTAARLFYDRNGDGVWGRSPDEPTLDEWSAHKGIRITPELKLWRKLHVEVDSMGPVQGNTNLDICQRGFEGPPGTWVVMLAIGGLEPHRFQGGVLVDANGSWFPIRDNGQLTVLLPYQPGDPVPAEFAPVTLWDDDAQEMPEMPDTGLMEEAYGAAYIYPVIDGGGDPANNKVTVPFSANVESEDAAILAQIEARNGLESHGNRSEAFWVAYVQAAYQAGPSRDYDPDSQGGVLGVVPTGGQKGALVFLEATRDYAQQLGLGLPQRVLLAQRIVVHETAHQFGVLDGQGGEPSVMHYNALLDLTKLMGSTFNESQCRTMRISRESPGT